MASNLRPYTHRIEIEAHSNGGGKLVLGNGKCVQNFAGDGEVDNSSCV